MSLAKEAAEKLAGQKRMERMAKSIAKKVESNKEVPEGLRKAYNVHASRPATRKTTKVTEPGVGEFTLEKFEPVDKGKAPKTRTVGELDVYNKSLGGIERQGGATVMHSHIDPEERGKGLATGKLYPTVAKRLSTGKGKGEGGWAWGKETGPTSMLSEDRSESADPVWRSLEKKYPGKITRSAGDPAKPRTAANKMYGERHPNIDKIKFDFGRK